MTNLFDVVGHHRDEPDRLLLHGGDGRFYACSLDDLAHGVTPAPTDPGEAWEMEPPPGA